MIALGIPYMDENVSAKVSPMYVGIFFASGISGELSQVVSDIYDTSMIHNNHLFHWEVSAAVKGVFEYKYDNENFNKNITYFICKMTWLHGVYVLWV